MEFCYLSFWPYLLESKTTWSLLKLMFQTFDLSGLVRCFDVNDTIVTYMYDRQDYKELVNACCQNVDNLEIFPLFDLKYKVNFRVKLQDLLSTIIYCFFTYKPLLKLTFKERFFLASHSIFYLSIIRELVRISPKHGLKDKAFLAFNSSFDLEALLVEYYKSKGVNTYHLSHGVSYILYNKDVPGDFVNGEGINAENILVWGESSKEDLVQNYNVRQEMIHIAGNPKYPLKNINVKQSFRHGIVFLARSIYDNDNIALIRKLCMFTQKTGIRLSIKPHPKSDISKFREAMSESGLIMLPFDCTISQILAEGVYDFSICYNTTAYYESMYFDMVAFRYAVNENECYLGLDDKFDTEDMLIHKIEDFKAIRLETLNMQIQELLIRVLGMGINNYLKILS